MMYNLLVLSIVIFLAPAYPGAEIIGDHEVKPHSRPYMASLQLRFRNRSVVHYCGGALIRPNWVLTAAHYICMKDDIMLLQLETDAKINQDVNVLNLPKGGITDMKSGTRCTVAGWGKTKINNYPDTLQEVEVEVIDHRTCNSMDYYNHTPEITQDMICVGDSKGRGDSCQGDSGGPLICDKIYTGIVSFGKEGCPYPQIPAVYTLLTKKYIDWIRDTIG
ncbi:granzyme K-like [Hypanus sabinus]|uniref:granzyme K-like n=1 Tax=Hypanus sabinus TaxID=79690 RepID=UPI0028C41739|nr:granzyme K-like [Hypanus sabinus]